MNFFITICTIIVFPYTSARSIQLINMPRTRRRPVSIPVALR